MDALALLRQARTAGLSVRGDGAGRLQMTGPKRLAPLPLVQQLRQHKAAVLDAWEVYEERVSIMEYDGKLPHDEAEHRVWACVQDEEAS